MSEEHNRAFVADPAGYSRKKTILVPNHGEFVGGSDWAKPKVGPFDLDEVNGSGFPGTVLILQECPKGRYGIQGIWFPYEDDKLCTFNVDAKENPYFVFTSKLGGCALGIKDQGDARTEFAHDATDNYVQHLDGWDLTLFRGAYDPNESGMNVTAFFWWNGTGWNLGQSKIYNAHYRRQKFNENEYPQAMAPAQSGCCTIL